MLFFLQRLLAVLFESKSNYSLIITFFAGKYVSEISIKNRNRGKVNKIT